MKQKEHIRCPKCEWEPYDGCKWLCDVCRTKWNTFDTHGVCPVCGKVFIDTQCPKSKGGCGEMSLNADWYEYMPVESKGISSLFFWKKKDKPPVTVIDKQWIENGLVLLTEMFDPVFYKSLITITPDNFNSQFTGSEEDAKFIFEKLIQIMHIDAWELQLMFYSNSPIEFSDGTVTTPQENLKGGWLTSTGRYIDNGLGHKEIWIELSLLTTPESLISTLSHELAHYKLLGEYRMEDNDEYLTDLTAIFLGFGIFKGNSYFKSGRWQAGRSQGWEMQRTGYLAEQLIAYAMAWLAHYRNEDILWKTFLNRTMLKYFEQSYDYIAKNKSSIKWD